MAVRGVLEAAADAKGGRGVSRIVGIVREWKTASERRAPLTPQAVFDLRDQGVTVKVESSPHRVYSDDAYARAGAEVTSDLDGCDLYLGIKEMPAERLHAGRPHVFFSHTIKGQPYNMPLLTAVLERRCTLLDYEVITDDAGRRLIFFGVQAGQAGMINSLWTLGRRLLVRGHDTALSTLEQARHYDSLVEAKAAILAAGDTMREEGLGDALHPIAVGITGVGNVSRGAQEILDMLEPVAIRPEDLVKGRAKELAGDAPVVKVVFRERHMVERRTSEEPYSRSEYRAHPDRYRGRFDDYLPHLHLLVTGNYWDARYPRLVNLAWLREHLQDPATRLVAIGDVSCDPDGGVECTVRSTLPEDPVYVYDPATGETRAGFDGPGIAMMAVDILPTELPRESSEQFSRLLGPLVEPLLDAEWMRPFDDLDVPGPLKRAIIAHAGSLTPAYAHLRDHC